MREVLLLSHELRTPLAVLSGYLQMLDEEDFSEDERRRIRRVMRDAICDLEQTVELLIERERRVAIAYGLDVPKLINPALTRSRSQILRAARTRRPMPMPVEGGAPGT